MAMILNDNTEILDQYKKEAKERSRAGLKQGSRDTVTESRGKGEALQLAADDFGTKKGKITNAQKIKKASPFPTRFSA